MFGGLRSEGLRVLRFHCFMCYGLGCEHNKGFKFSLYGLLCFVCLRFYDLSVLGFQGFMSYGLSFETKLLPAARAEALLFRC